MFLLAPVGASHLVCELEIKRKDEKPLISDLVTVTEAALRRLEGLGVVSVPVPVMNLTDLCCAPRELVLFRCTN